MSAHPVIRTARKAGRCANRHASLAGNADGCTLTIETGDRYLEGDCDPYSAGGFGRDRICLPCARRDGQVAS